jgi:hypothetical protein
MHRRLLTDFLFGHFDPLLGPLLKRLTAQMNEARIVIESWRRHTTERAHGSLGYKPAPDVFIPAFARAAETEATQPPALAPRPTMH